MVEQRHPPNAVPGRTSRLKIQDGIKIPIRNELKQMQLSHNFNKGFDIRNNRRNCNLNPIIKLSMRINYQLTKALCLQVMQDHHNGKTARLQKVLNAKRFS